MRDAYFAIIITFLFISCLVVRLHFVTRLSTHCWHSIYSKHALHSVCTHHTDHHRVADTRQNNNCACITLNRLPSHRLASVNLCIAPNRALLSMWVCSVHCLSIRTRMLVCEPSSISISMEHYYVAISRTRAQKLNCLIKFAFAIYLTDIVLQNFASMYVCVCTPFIAEEKYHIVWVSHTQRMQSNQRRTNLKAKDENVSFFGGFVRGANIVRGLLKGRNKRIYNTLLALTSLKYEWRGFWMRNLRFRQMLADELFQHIIWWKPDIWKTPIISPAPRDRMTRAPC